MISAKAIRFSRFSDQVFVEGRNPIPSNCLPPNPSAEAHRGMIPGHNPDMIPGFPGGVQIQMNSIHTQSSGRGMNVTSSSAWGSVRPVQIPLPIPGSKNAISPNTPSRKKPVIGPLAPLPPGVQLTKPRPYPPRPQHVVSPLDRNDAKLTREEQIDDFRRFGEAFDKQWLSGIHRGNSWVETRFPVKSSDLKKAIRAEMKQPQIASPPNAFTRVVENGGHVRGRRDKKEDHAMHSKAGENRGNSMSGGDTPGDHVEEPEIGSRRTDWCARVTHSTS